MRKNEKSEVKQVAKLKQCIVHSATYGIYLYFRLWSALCSGNQLKFEVGVQYRCIFCLFCREFNTSGAKVF